MSNRDRTNMSQEPVSVRKQKRGPVGMSLPRSDDGKVHKATGTRDNTSAAHYADAMDKVIGGQSGPARKTTNGR